MNLNEFSVGTYRNELGEIVSYKCDFYAPLEVSEQTLEMTGMKRISDDLWESQNLQVKKYGEVYHLRYRLYNTGSVFMRVINGIHQLQQAYLLFEGKELEVKI